MSVIKVQTPLHDWVNSANHFFHLGYHYNSRLLLPNNRIPPRGPGSKKTAEEKKAIEDSTRLFKEAIWNGPARIPADRADSTGCGGNTTTGNLIKDFLEPRNVSIL